jgi:hypothetical protein
MTIWNRMFGGGGAGGAETRALTLRIRELLKEGKSPAEAREMLIQEGVRPRRAASMVALVIKAEATARRMFDPEA